MVWIGRCKVGACRATFAVHDERTCKRTTGDHVRRCHVQEWRDWLKSKEALPPLFTTAPGVPDTMTNNPYPRKADA